MQTVVCILDKTLLVLGAGTDQIPGFIKAKEMGIKTIALDGNPDAPAKNYANEFHIASIKHFDQIETFINNTLTTKIDGVIAFGVDIPLIIAKTADLLNVNHTISQTAAALSENKFLSKCMMSKLGIAIPAYAKVNSVVDIEKFINIYGFPIILKPTDNSAARGISYVDSMKNIEAAFQYALDFSQSNNVIVEQYLDGPQISSESFVIEGQIHNIGFADRNYADMKRFFPNIIENGGDLPSIHMTSIHKENLSKYFKAICDELNIKNGVIKGDLVIHNGKLYIIEFALRLSGGNFSTIEIPESTGIDFLAVAIKLHLGLPIQISDLQSTKNQYISLRYKFSEESQAGIIQKINFPLQKDDIILASFHVKQGDIIKEKTTDHAKRLGFALAKGKTRSEAIQKAQHFLDKVKIVIE